jgi:hypothetical protein
MCTQCLQHPALSLHSQSESPVVSGAGGGVARKTFTGFLAGAGRAQRGRGGLRWQLHFSTFLRWNGEWLVSAHPGDGETVPDPSHPLHKPRKASPAESHGTSLQVPSLQN